MQYEMYEVHLTAWARSLRQLAATGCGPAVAPGTATWRQWGQPRMVSCTKESSMLLMAWLR